MNWSVFLLSRGLKYVKGLEPRKEFKDVSEVSGQSKLTNDLVVDEMNVL
jgi:hypothetical protein